MDLYDLKNKKIKDVIEECNGVKIIFDNDSFYCFKATLDYEGDYSYVTLIHGSKEIDDLISPYVY